MKVHTLQALMTTFRLMKGVVYCWETWAKKEYESTQHDTQTSEEKQDAAASISGRAY